MTSSKTRHNTLSLLRRRDRENALEELDAALMESDKIASDLDSIESTITALNTHLGDAQISGKATGRDLQMCLEGRQHTRYELKRYLAKEQEVRNIALSASERVARAKEAVAKAQKALRALEKDESD
jgi:hypothetical protein